MAAVEGLPKPWLDLARYREVRLREARYEAELASEFLAEVNAWRGLAVVDLPLDEERMAAELASKVGLDFDDGLHYYAAKKLNVPIISFDRDFDSTDIKRLEPSDALG